MASISSRPRPVKSAHWILSEPAIALAQSLPAVPKSIGLI